MSDTDADLDELLRRRQEVQSALQARIERDEALLAEYDRRVARLARNTRTLAKFEALNVLFEIEQSELKFLNLALRQRCFGEPEATPEPPREMPPELRDAYTMGGRIPVQNSYCDYTYPSNHPYIYTDFEIDAYIERMERREYFIYGELDYLLWDAFEKYPIAGLELANMGSLTPWYEATCIRFGCRPTTIEYNRIITRTDRMRVMTVAEWDRGRPCFDCGLSISSFEHDGLGAYGEPLDPDADLKAMQKMKEIVKPEGLLFLNVPTGPDLVMWNNARVYGPIRLPLLMRNWTWIDSFGLRQELLDGKAQGEPLFILRND